MPDERRTRWEAHGLTYDDQQVSDNEAPAQEAPPAYRRRVPWPQTPDELDCRWERGERGWLSVRDPFTGERWAVPTKYADPAAWQWAAGAEPVPQTWVRRAMDKLPPRRKR